MVTVTVDEEPMDGAELAGATLAELIKRAQHAASQRERIVVSVKIDGKELAWESLETTGAELVSTFGTVAIETARPSELATDALQETRELFEQARASQSQAAEMISQGNTAKALELLASCFSIWDGAKDAVWKSGQLLNLDFASLSMEGQGLEEIFATLSDQLRQIKEALEDRDFVLLGDLLTYELDETITKWQRMIQFLVEHIAAVCGGR